MARKKFLTKAEIDAEVIKHTNITGLASKFCTYLFLLAIVFVGGFFMKEIVSILAGKSTLANIGLNLGVLADFKISEVLGGGIGVGGIVYGLSERTYRKSKVRRMGDRIKLLEEKIDPNRSSSGLTPRGNTRREDK